MLVLGCDPGSDGALVLIDYEARRVVDFLDMPVIIKGEVSIVDPVETFLWLQKLQGLDVIAFVELVNTWSRASRTADPRKQNAIQASIAKLIGLARGLEMLLVLAGIPFQHVTPAAWKGRARLHKKPKEAALGVARMELRWPEGAIKLKKHIGRADAALIALYGQSPTRTPRPRLTDEMARLAAENVPPGALFEVTEEPGPLEALLPTRKPRILRSRRTRA